jgi:hypothetical protein
MTMKKMTPTRAFGAAVPLAAILVFGACDLKVSNPGPVQDQFLNDKAAVPAIVNGAGRDLSDALNWTAYTGAAIAREIYPGGSTGSFGISVNWQNGKLTDDETDVHWNRAQRARWIAEHGTERMRTILGTDFAKSKDAAQILIWAGYSNRFLGENFCDGVIDGGAPQDYKVYFTRAEANFTEALAVATAAGNTALANTARAGRAATELDLGKYTEAAADANSITDNAFVYVMPYNTTEEATWNRIYWATANQPYRAHTVFNTYYDSYYTNTKDPRVSWGSDPIKNPVGDGAVNGKPVTWHFETKFTKKESPINLSSGWEMRLIEAEVKLVGGDVPGAMTSLNMHRLALSLVPWTATTADEAWTALKRERGIELWLEGRRLNDFRRWAAANRPGAYDALENMAGRDLCFVTPLSEKQTNPNFPMP